MHVMGEQIAVSLKKRGFLHRSPDTWVWRGMTVKFRPQDESFLVHYTDGQREEFSFYDFTGEGEENHIAFLMLLQFVEERQRLAIFGGEAKKAA
jgi:hypothetical protein